MPHSPALPAWKDELDAIAGHIRHWSLAALFLTLGLLPAPVQASSLNDDECEAQGRNLANLLTQRKVEVILSLVDLVTNFDRVTDGLDLDERRRVMIREAYRTTTVRFLRANLRQYDEARFVRVQWVDGERCALIRVEDKDTATYNYLGFTLVREEFGDGIKIVDLSDFLSGETMAQRSHNLLTEILAMQEKAIRERSPEAMQAYLDNLDQLGDAFDLVSAHQCSQALKTIRLLPEGWMKRRSVLYVRFLASQNIDPEECQRTAQDWAEAFPNDPPLSMVKAHTDELEKKYDEAIRHVDALLGLIGEDSHLYLQKAELCLKNNDPTGATDSARTALEKNPGLNRAWVVLVKAALLAKDHPATLVVLKKFNRKFPRFDPTSLIEAAPGYKEFCESADFQKWIALR